LNLQKNTGAQDFMIHSPLVGAHKGGRERESAMAQ
jgi:hypothetical protein